MENKLTKKYGLFTAICMVVGIVVGSGVFFKAQNILNTTNGDMPLGIIAWIIGGAAMLICILNFATLSGHYEKCNGLVDYAEETCGKGFAYYVAWFSTFIYYPGMTSALAWVSARYTVALFGGDITGGLCMTLGCFYLCAAYAVNALSPKLAGKFQVSTTVIKFIPLLVMAIGGIIFGLANGNMQTAFATSGAAASTEGGSMNALFASVVATAFAYEGWIIATSINSEIKNSKKNLPIALSVGGVVIIFIYVVYYIGIAGAAENVQSLMDNGANAAFEFMLGGVGGKIVSALIVVSCLGTLNGLMVASTRGMYSIAVRNQGPDPETFSQVDSRTNMPGNAAVIGLIVAAAWLFFFFGANLNENFANPIFGVFNFDSSELPIITIYGFYIPIFIMFIKKKGHSVDENGKQHPFKNIVMPVMAIVASAFMVFAALYSHGLTPYQTAQKALKQDKVVTCTVEKDVWGEVTVKSDAADITYEKNGNAITLTVPEREKLEQTKSLPEKDPEAMKEAKLSFDATKDFENGESYTLTAYNEVSDAHFSCPVLFYLIIFAAFLLVGSFFYKKERNK